MALRTASRVRISRNAIPLDSKRLRARAERRPKSSQISWPEGTSAEWGSDMPSASPTTWDVAAVPRNWQPPPGVAHVWQASSEASSSESSP